MSLYFGTECYSFEPKALLYLSRIAEEIINRDEQSHDLGVQRIVS